MGAKRRVSAIVQARMSSTRLPGKILMPISGRPLLGRVIDCVRQCPLVDQIIVATTSANSDAAVVDFCERENIASYRGDVEDVLGRFINTAEAFDCETIVRVCSDNPFLDAGLLTTLIQATRPDDDYCSYITTAGEPLIVKPLGLCAEIVTRAALERIKAICTDPKYFEFVTMYIYRHPEQFRINWLPLPNYIDPELRFTVDYPADMAVCERIIVDGGGRDARGLMTLVRKDPALAASIRGVVTQHPKIYC
jgi:spore coat polysaccharide biosynthesis protein SpsF